MRKLLPHTPIQKMASPVPIREVGGKIIKTDDYMIVKLAFHDKLKDTFVKGVVTTEIHIIDDFAANLLLGNDVLCPKKMSLDLGQRQLTIGSCEGMKLPLQVEARVDPHVKRTIRARRALTIMPRELAKIPVTYHGNLPNDRDLLFEPNCPHYLGQDGGVYAHIVDVDLDKILVRNTLTTPINLARRVQLGTVTEYNQADYYLTMPEEAHKAAGD